jgi:hypothetical protein
MSGKARAAVGSVTKLDRATVIASWAKSRGSSSTLAVKWMRPCPRAATSFRNAASGSDSLPSPITLTVIPSGLRVSSSRWYSPGSSASAASANRTMCLVPLSDSWTIFAAVTSAV